MKKFEYLRSSCDRGFFFSVICMQLSFHLAQGGPLSHYSPDLDIANNSLAPSVPSHSAGCRYQGSFYTAGEEVPTTEPCLVCECKAAVVCKLRICQEIPVPPPPSCIVVHKARKCCARLVCNNHVHETTRKLSREQKLPAVSTTLSSTPTRDNSSTGSKGYCVLDGTVYAEGSAMRSSSLCQYCFCIRGEMKCSSPQCVIPMNGCKPKFRSYACCPTNYDCQESNSSAIIQTLPTSTPLPSFLKGCMVNGKRIDEGEPVLPLQLENQTNPCQTCFCMGGVVHCRPLECDRPIEGCRPVTEPGHCCPDRYDCSAVGSPTTQATAKLLPSLITKTLKEDDLQELQTHSMVTPVSEELMTPKAPALLPVAEKLQDTTIPPGTTEKRQQQTSPPLTTASETLPEITTFSTATEFIEPETTVVPTEIIYDVAEQEETLPELVKQKTILSNLSTSSQQEASSSEKAFNVLLKSKLDGGSREERRNKDKHDFHPQTSFEDDLKDDSSSRSFENVGVEAEEESSSSTSVEDTTDHASLNSEIETEADLSPTEENDVESEPALFKSDSEQFSVSSSSSSDESSEVPILTSLPVTMVDVKTEPESTPEPASASHSEMESEAGDVTTSTISSTSSASPLVLENEEREGVTEEPTEESFTGDLGALNFSLSAISGMSEDSGADAELAAATTTTVINQDVESTEVPPAVSPATTPPNLIPPISSMETTVRNVHFIPFGVEDAVTSPLNDSMYEQVPPLQSAYDNHALRISLIPPTPPKGYVRATEKTGAGGAPLPLSYVAEKPLAPTAVEVNGTLDELGNAIMDVPVSTSLYSHGYYRNGIITDESGKESLELEISSRRPFPGQVFDDDDGSVKLMPSLPQKRIGDAVAQPGLPPSPALPGGVNTSLSDSNPARTYSKFGIQDSAYYRYGYGSPKSTSPSSVLMSPPSHHHHHQNNHHRYYQAPEGDQVRPRNPHRDYHLPGSEDDVAYEGDEDGEISDEEQSFEDLNQNSNEGPSLSSPPAPQTLPPGMGTSGRTDSTTSSSTISTTTARTQSIASMNDLKKIEAFSSSNSNTTPGKDGSAFRPSAVAYPFPIPKKPAGLEFNLGLKLSGCNIYGKMHNVGDIIRELSSSCIRCLCTEVGVQCSGTPC